MAAAGFIVAYLGLWAAWSSLVGAALQPRPGRVLPLGFMSCGAILASALAPVLALSLAGRYTTWLSSGTNEILSLATPPALMLFVTQQLRRLGPRPGDDVDGSPRPG